MFCRLALSLVQNVMTCALVPLSLVVLAALFRFVIGFMRLMDLSNLPSVSLSLCLCLVSVLQGF